MLQRIATAVALATALSGCELVGTTGSGAVTSETRQTPSFTRVQVNNGIGFAVRIGPSQAIEVRAQENILPVIATDVQDGALQIHSTRGYTTSEGVDVTVVAPSLEGIWISGGSQGRLEGLNADTFKIDVSGGGALTGTGSTRTLTISVTGGSRASLQDLATKAITLDMSGGSNVTLRASEQVAGIASGGSHVTVLGGARLAIDTSGGAEVSHQ